MQLKEAGTIPTQPATTQGQMQQQPATGQPTQQGQQPQQSQMQQQPATGQPTQQGQQPQQGFNQQDIDAIYASLSQKTQDGNTSFADIQSEFNKFMNMKQKGMSQPQQAQNPQMQASQGLMNRAATGQPQAAGNVQ